MEETQFLQDYFRRSLDYAKDHPATRNRQSKPNSRINTPWDAKGLLLEAVGAVSSGHAHSGDIQWRGGIVSALMSSHIYLWTQETLIQANNLQLPPHRVQAEQIPFNDTFHCWDAPISCSAPYRETSDYWEIEPGDQTFNSWMLLHYAPPERTGNQGEIVCLSDLINATKKTVHIVSDTVDIGTFFPDDVDEEHLITYQRVLGMMAFLNLPFIEIDHQGLPRAQRRQQQFYEDKHTVRVTETPGVVRLRREYHINPPKPDGEGRPTNHTYRWWNSGHLRNQAWGPKHSLRRLQWIPAFIKGPEGMPLKETQYRVDR